ncbi:type II toxin-antitoxin system death-on-curing family toxin [Methylobacterium sp. SyP6R]|uniref:type II toxin-antitoxin system death-on-curing family toxin n=1 Tax=Methylobacterium sp. SyP6R TaxID=2718876 RepID=UPI001F00CCF7|nr:type II toxin-antitoxin system death-on-curing family toxin [Methylobacterium sp. SyP6R]MCF4126271.1 type II toxin-antitoxin system death-on-curing family toxin [Methylobacterium sp. SyP6R]
MPADPPIWITADEIEAINQEILSETSEPFHVLNRGGLESAAARPLNAWAYEGEDDRIVLAVRLLEGIGQNHCFQQGNKRTAFFAALEFIERNGGEYAVNDSDDLGRLCEAVILRQAAPMELVAMLRRRVRF